MKRLFLIVFALLLGSCTSRVGDFTVMSTRNVDWSNAAGFERGERITASDTMHMILIIPTKFEISIEEAIDRALDKIPGAVALTDVVVKTRVVPLLLYNQMAYVIEATPLIDPSIIVPQSKRIAGSPYCVLTMQEDGSVTLEHVTEEAFLELQEQIGE